MSTITTGVEKQYSDSQKLAARARLNREYTIAEVGWFSWVARQLPLKGGNRILDVGCGPAWFWAATVKELPEKLELTLSDLSPGMVQEALERCRPLPFEAVTGQQADVIALPFEDGSFDSVIAMHVLYHLPDPTHGIAEMYRVLKPGGFLAVTTNGAGHMRKIYELTTVLGSPPQDPGGAAFGFEKAERFMQAKFGNVAMTQHPARLRVTEPEDLFLALTSYPPADQASEAELAEFRNAIAEAFQAGDGVIEAEKKNGLFVSRKVA
ncbi:MAG: class I SAM-dependent methyltransferase [Hoeflea sp.]|uniref:class I SAM-dependent methyltransferase n=1 Tax=Hoeflea sp. TaxID=1940281 RepID=UPI001D65B315|nr:class I SAM-dependent methyltransferase [Hoeflea sp.]MBU4530942.1 class I SAM-dependent methyltransferase [Alphaproteobacteria bacterium]MBU4542717.1 class I SAM-dependent methyltransferase [Alphaproteobacteria bacterium]MBU4549356.1 class I SAM-dependent methyltransferase [Alphaproteobacteria bacterium]MBV1722834.1 class I SAM-dependent methyltransferase [Hoeflea sp.]MBV1761556.1 class I SAM-dependent methyltransferase [Hoeflea sp.]